MKTYGADEMLKAGDLFELTQDPDSGASVF